MTVARTVADVLADHVTFEVECIDRMFLNVYQPRLQHAGGIVSFVHRNLRLPIASAAPLAKISDRFDRAVRRFAKDEGVPWVDFVKGQRKDDVMAERLRHFTPEDGVVVHRPGATPSSAACATNGNGRPSPTSSGRYQGP
jgi:hypothetical protein